jgi:AcrR family transcriptional regulator
MTTRTTPFNPQTTSQHSRWERVAEATIELGNTGGYDAVQMREVSLQSKVAMGTVYRYFLSKDHLLAAVLVYWMQGAANKIDVLQLSGNDAATKVSNMLIELSAALEEKPLFCAAVMTALASSETQVVDCRKTINALLKDMMLQAVGEPTPPGLEEKLRIMSYIWFAVMQNWSSFQVNGITKVPTPENEFSLVARLLFS